MQFYYNGQPAFEKDHQYTVRTYAKHIMDNYQDDKTLDLMKKMVNYGAASQIHFGYRVDDLANDFLANKPDYSQVTISGFDSRGVQGTEKVKLYSASLLLTSETTLRLFFTAECPITLNGKPLKIQYRGGLCYVDIRGIDAKELDDDVTVMLHDGTPTPVTYNPMAYCQAVQNSPAGSYTDEMQDLVRALYLYNQSSDYYFDNTVTQGANMIDALHYVNADNTTAKITAQHGLIYHKLLSRFGADVARGYYDANTAAIAEYRRFAQTIDCDFADADNYIYSRRKESLIDRELEALDKI
jgi:hypothetical protein